MNNQGCFKSIEILEEIRNHAKSEINSYSSNHWASNLIDGKYDDLYFQSSNLILKEKILPEVPKGITKDFETDILLAKELYENLEISTELVANDGRIWTYLSLGKYRRHIYNRYNCVEPKKMETILGYFFFKGASANSIASNPISKLWWGIHKTIDTSLSDPYEYSNILFSNSQVLFDVIERATIVSNRNLVEAFLEVIKDHQQNPSKVSENLAPMILNHLSNHSFDNMSKKEIYIFLNHFIQFLKDQKRI